MTYDNNFPCQSLSKSSYFLIYIYQNFYIIHNMSYLLVYIFFSSSTTLQVFGLAGSIVQGLKMWQFSSFVSYLICAVHATDASRLDLIIPGEAHFYVKAATPQERQQWLVALGSSKAGQNNSAAAASMHHSKG